MNVYSRPEADRVAKLIFAIGLPVYDLVSHL